MNVEEVKVCRMVSGARRIRCGLRLTGFSLWALVTLLRMIFVWRLGACDA